MKIEPKLYLFFVGLTWTTLMDNSLKMCNQVDTVTTKVTYNRDQVSFENKYNTIATHAPRILMNTLDLLTSTNGPAYKLIYSSSHNNAAKGRERSLLK